MRNMSFQIDLTDAFIYFWQFQDESKEGRKQVWLTNALESKEIAQRNIC